MATKAWFVAAIGAAIVLGGAAFERREHAIFEKDRGHIPAIQKVFRNTTFVKRAGTNLCYQYYEIDVHSLLNVVPVLTYVPCAEIPPELLQTIKP